MKKTTQAAASTMLLLAAMLATSGCTKNSLAANSSGGPGEPKITLEGIGPDGAQSTDAFEVLTERKLDGYEVAVVAASDAANMEEAFLAVNYDRTQFHSTSIATPQSTSGQGNLALAVEARPGRIEAGVVRAGHDSAAAVKAGDVLVNFKLKPGPQRTAFSVPGSSSARAKNLSLARDTDENWVLSWDYTNPGDGNQDGMVGINDLTPIGQYFQQTVANSWDDPRRHVDGDGNGEINASDIVPIGQNYNIEVWAYQIEMAEGGSGDFVTVGQLLLGEQQVPPGETVNFSYTFAAQYVEGAWYRVVPLDNNLKFGIPSESISENGRRIEGLEVATGDTVTVTTFAQGLEVPMAHLNSVRVVFPDSYKYVPGSANPGSPGGFTSTADGIWGSFVTTMLFPPDSFFVTQSAGDGWDAVEFNVSVVDGNSPAAPVGYGDLINFKLESLEGEPLTIYFEEQTADGVKRTYYTDENEGAHFFGNKIGMRVQ